jgi:hypothetical protein
MNEPVEIYDRFALDAYIADSCNETDARIIRNYIDRLEARIKHITKRSRMACEIVGDHFVDEALMYAEISDDA